MFACLDVPLFDVFDTSRGSPQRLASPLPPDPMGVSSEGCRRLLVDAPRNARSSTGRGWALGREHTHMEAPTMPNGMRWVGLDVHAHASAVAVFDDVTGEVITRRVCGRPWVVHAVLRELPRPLRAVYEAGPTGYWLVRRA